MSAPPKVLELVDLFQRNADAYHAPQYNEAMVRQEFINPLFKCLGWDMDNEQGYAETYKNVIHEAAIKIGGATKSARLLFPHRRCSQVLPVTFFPCSVGLFDSDGLLRVVFLRYSARSTAGTSRLTNSSTSCTA